MSGWMERNGLQLTRRGERVIGAAVGALVTASIIATGFIEGGMVP